MPESSWSGAEERVPTDDHVAYGGFHGAASRRHLLLPVLHAVQDSIGWVSHGALNYVSKRIPVAPAEAYGVATFYDLITTEHMPARVARVCDDVVCKAGDGNKLISDLEAELGPENTANGESMWVRSACLGHCEKGTVAFIQRAGEQALTIAPATADEIAAVLRGDSVTTNTPPVPAPFFTALTKAHTMGAAAVRNEVVASGIRGRGGAAFPVGVKWNGVANAPGDTKYVVCNADESEPGTFKDRWLIEQNPFALIEGIAIAAFAVGASKAYIYIRGEYREAEDLLASALEVAGSDLDVDIEIRRGAGAYICGEETALFNSIEGFRGQPRQKPPFPTQSGLFGSPTLINNVETLAAIPGIVTDRGAAFAQIGTEESTGLKLFCVSGNVGNPGVYHVEFGVTTRELINLAGGANGEIQAVLTGGAAGSFLTETQLDVPLTFEDGRDSGISLGSGAIIVFNTDVDMMEITHRIAEFFAHESCGLCVPCRVGTTRQLDIVGRMREGSDTQTDRRDLDNIGWVMRDASICGLGHTASNAVESAIRIGLIGSDA
ncbi:MAG: NAD(P)H-dependent oxidoreductase subunit E [Acidimicrobiia bacterium]|nr:MAG: NAD(P)H-dependent oxidoreductase subunit E [Acidimicrobiia bacterium]